MMQLTPALRREVRSKLEFWLQSPTGAEAERDPSGHVALADALCLCPDLDELCGGSAEVLAKAIAASDIPASTGEAAAPAPDASTPAALVLDEAQTGVRLRPLAERVRLAVEAQVKAAPSCSVSLLDLLRSRAVDALLGDITETVEQLQALKDAVVQSQAVQLVGSRVVVRPDWSLAAPAWWPAAWAVPMPWPGPAAAPQAEAGMFQLPTSESLGDASCYGAWEPTVGGWHYMETPQKTPWRERMCAMVAELLERPTEQLREAADADGWIPAAQVLAASPTLGHKLAHNACALVNLVASCGQHLVMADANSVSVRLRTTEERLVTLCELYVACKVSQLPPATWGVDAAAAPVQHAPVSWEELLAQPCVQDLLSGAVAASSTEGVQAWPDNLREVLEKSEVLKVSDDGVVIPFPHRLLRTCVEGLLAQDARALALLDREGEVSIQWVALQPVVRKTLDRLAVRGNAASCAAVRAAMELSASFALQEARMSLRPVGPPPACAVAAEHGTEEGVAEEGAPPPALGGESAPAAGVDRRRKGRVPMPLSEFLGESAPQPPPKAARRLPESPAWRLRLIPIEKDAWHLRSLLTYYFRPFNLQHNRVLMAALEERRRAAPGGRSSARGLFSRFGAPRPAFELGEVQALPRIGKLLSGYEPGAAPFLLAAALQPEGRMPVRLRPKQQLGAPRGAWACQDPLLELTYVPDLRFIECTKPTRKEALALTSRGPGPCDPVQALPGNAVCVVSYSVSSDMSNSQSPKALAVAEAVSRGDLSESSLTWESRQQRIVRQLMLHTPDIICLQGLQSLGFAERCSEAAPDWFDCDREPPQNHLVHLYRELSKENYAVAFAPTMKLPGSDVLCLGNAIFWKRSRWHMREFWGVHNAAVCVELASRLAAPTLLVCSFKSAAVYAQEWADAATEEELAEPLRNVHSWMTAATTWNKANPIWCGDFGCDWGAIHRLLEGSTAGTGACARWASAVWSVLGRELSATAFAGGGGGGGASAARASDFVLHGPGLSPIAVLAGSQGTPSLAELLRAGNPSDHLLQTALFVGATPCASATEA